MAKKSKVRKKLSKDDDGNFVDRNEGGIEAGLDIVNEVASNAENLLGSVGESIPIFNIGAKYVMKLRADKRLDKTIDLIKEAISEVDESKLDREYLESGEFANLIINTYENALTADNQRQLDLMKQALKNAVSTSGRDKKLQRDAIMGFMRGMTILEFQILHIVDRRETRDHPLNQERLHQEINGAKYNAGLGGDDLNMWCFILVGRNFLHHAGTYPIGHGHKRFNKWRVAPLGKMVLQMVHGFNFENVGG